MPGYGFKLNTYADENFLLADQILSIQIKVRQFLIPTFKSDLCLENKQNEVLWGKYHF